MAPLMKIILRSSKKCSSSWCRCQICKISFFGC